MLEDFLEMALPVGAESQRLEKPRRVVNDLRDGLVDTESR